MSSKVDCGQGAEQHSPVKSPKLRKLLNYVKGSCYQTWFISSSVPKVRQLYLPLCSSVIYLESGGKTCQNTLLFLRALRSQFANCKGMEMNAISPPPRCPPARTGGSFERGTATRKGLMNHRFPPIFFPCYSTKAKCINCLCAFRTPVIKLLAV